MIVNQAPEVDILPAFCQARVLILGVGNLLFGDDGFGPAVVEELIQNYAIPEDIYVMDVGTGVRKLLFTLLLGDVTPAEIMIADAVDWGNKIGQVDQITADELPVTKIDDFSLHQVPTSNMLRELQEKGQVEVSVMICDVGILPQRIAPGLSDGVRKAVKTAVGKIATRFSLEPL
jgi:coenzyme F420 hydrogenase subunit delta